LETYILERAGYGMFRPTRLEGLGGAKTSPGEKTTPENDMQK